MVNAIVDTLKTAFPRSEPQSPTDDIDEVDGLRMGSDKKNKYGSGCKNKLYFILLFRNIKLFLCLYTQLRLFFITSEGLGLSFRPKMSP